MNASQRAAGGQAVDPDARRLIFVTTRRHRYTVRSLAAPLASVGVTLERWAYSRLFRPSILPRATYILADFDRLHPWHLEAAALLRARLCTAGATVLNDPRRFVPRASLLRRLFRAGINDFTCWLPAEGEWPDRYPVFLRTINAHRGAESGLLADRSAAEAALSAALAANRVTSDLVFVEYRAEPEPGSGVFRKHACYGVGGAVIRALTVTDRNWMAKIGEVGAASAQNYRDDLAEHHSYPHEEIARRVFDLAGLDFGRIDFAIVGGRPQIYEVNSNPAIGAPREHPSDDRMEADRLFRDGLVAALAGLGFPPPGRIDVSDLFRRNERRSVTLAQP